MTRPDPPRVVLVRESALRRLFAGYRKYAADAWLEARPCHIWWPDDGVTIVADPLVSIERSRFLPGEVVDMAPAPLDPPRVSKMVTLEAAADAVYRLQHEEHSRHHPRWDVGACPRCRSFTEAIRAMEATASPAPPWLDTPLTAEESAAAAKAHEATAPWDVDDAAGVRVDVFRACWQQDVNANPVGVRLTHVPSGMAVVAQDHRSLHRNKAAALASLTVLLTGEPVEQDTAPAPTDADVERVAEYLRHVWAGDLSWRDAARAAIALGADVCRIGGG